MFKSFGNTVKIKTSPETEETGTAGMIGEVYGETTPSVTGVEVIGFPKRDYAVNVYFKEMKTSWWFDEELLEVINSGEHSIMTIGEHSFIKTEKGDWIPHQINKSVPTKKWWHFWR